MSTSTRRALLSLLASALVGAGLGLVVAHCSLYVQPDPYMPPPLVLQGTKPIADGGADD